MPILPHVHLLTLSIDVDFARVAMIGKTPAGLRRIAQVTGGSFTGDRLHGTVLPGSDWVIHRPDGVMLIDVRLLLKADGGELIYLTYQGRFLAEAEALAKFSAGGQLDPSEYSLAMVAKFECGAERLHWLNNVIAVGSGQQTPTGAVYSIFEIS